jgi:hypothetical protein
MLVSRHRQLHTVRLLSKGSSSVAPTWPSVSEHFLQCRTTLVQVAVFHPLLGRSVCGEVCWQVAPNLIQVLLLLRKGSPHDKHQRNCCPGQHSTRDSKAQ